jgi:hypothetical protein
MNPTWHGVIVWREWSIVSMCRLCRSGNLAGDMEGIDLALAFLRHAVPGGEALDDEAATGGAVTLAHDVLISLEGLDLHGQTLERRLLLGGERDDARHLGDEGVSKGVQSVHDAAPRSRREHGRVSQPSVPRFVRRR